MTAPPVWVTAFIDLPADRFEVGVAFWRGVTGYGLSPSRGEHDEFATLVPPEGTPHLRVQRVPDGESRVHVDLHRPDTRFAVHRSPGGLPWCSVPEPGGLPSSPAEWPGGHRVVVDQVCIDAPAAAHEAEVAFWAEQTGWPVRASSVSASFRSLARPPGLPVRLLLQQVDDDRPQVTAHLDLATDDRPSETARHEALGAAVRAVFSHWTVLADPTGMAYCLTDRDPDTGLLSSSG